MIDITGLDKAEVLAALFNGSKQQGMGFLDERGAVDMTADQARDILKQTVDFDYLYGRIMKISLRDNQLNAWLYDRDNGQGAAEAIIDDLRQKTFSDSEFEQAN